MNLTSDQLKPCHEISQFRDQQSTIELASLKEVRDWEREARKDVTSSD